MMKRTCVLVVAVFGCFIATSISGDDGCAPDDFCGSLKDNGYCGNSAHCSSNLKWFHNAATGKCQVFRYYGDGGNYNRFNSKEQCEKTCIGHSKYYKPTRLCKTCPKPVKIDVPFDFNYLKQNGFFCNGDDCNCPFGTKCCPVIYRVNSGGDSAIVSGVGDVEVGGREGDVVEREDLTDGLPQQARRISKELNGYKCVPIVQRKCEDAIEHRCSKSKRKTRRTYH